MKKVISFILAITFVVCVYCYGTTSRFSLEKYVENISMGFREMPSINDLVECWSLDYYWLDGARFMPYWVDCYVMAYDSESEEQYVFYMGNYPLAYEHDGTLSDRYPITYLPLLNEDGTPLSMNINGEIVTGNFPVLTQAYQQFESYEGPDFIGILEAGANTKAFFQRINNTFEVVAKGAQVLYHNLYVLAPWNAVVRR